MADKLEGTAIIANTVSGDRIVTGSITTTQLAPSVAAFVNSGQPLKIQTITYPGDDTAANTDGGQTIVLTGTGFKQNVQVYINSNAVPSVTYANANSISFTAPALAAATYPIYVINTDDGATAILIPGIQYSGTPTWTTTTPLTTQTAFDAWNIQLVATSDSAVSYSLQAGSSLPDGITLAANGLISGTMTSPPEDVTTYNFTVVANDLEQQDASRAFSVSVTVAVLDPFFTYTTLLLHGDGTNNANNHAFVDSSNNNFTITRNGNATQGTFSPFGDNWSVYLDGNGDYLRTSLNAVNIRTTSHTIEGWFYTTTSSAFTVFSCSETAGVAGGVYYLNEYQGTVYLGDGSSNNLTFSASLIPLNQWFHIALTFDGTTYKVFINGNLVGSSTTLLANFTLNGIDIGARLSGVTQYTTGYISNYRVLKGTALYTSAFTPPTQPLTPVSNTSLLTCQSNAFVDKGPNRFAITRNGDARVTKFDPFKPYKAVPASYGVYFDGTSDYLDFPANTACAFGTGDFTVECWMRTSTTSADSFYRRVFMVDGPTGNAGGNFQITLTPSSGYILLWDSVLSLSGAINVCDGNWHHIAATRSGTTLRLFVDGVLDTSGTYSTSVSPNSGSPRPRIGSFDGSSGDFEGYISNLRVLKGTALYTTTFTPPTSQLTAVANTQLLTCQSTTIIDNSTNAFTITRNGDARPTDLNPFTTTFVSEKYNTANGGGSLYCDGTGDYLTLADNAAFTVGSDDFTVDFWIYNNTTGARRFIYGQSNSGGQNVNIPFSIYKNSSNKLQFDVFASGSGTQYSATSSADLPLNQWVYVACVRNGTTTRIYINGVQDGTNATISTITLVDSSNLLGIGCIGEVTSDTWLGYISNLRFIKGTCLYPSGTPFILPTSPVTAIANTQLLCNFTNAGILDSVGKNVLETVGDARVNTSIKKYGTGSMYFDGTGDYLIGQAGVIPAIRTGDFTVECWTYLPNVTPTSCWRGLISIGNGHLTSGGFTLYAPRSDSVVGSAVVIINTVNPTLGGTTSINDSQWHHVAVTRTGGVLRLFVDGILQASTNNTADITQTQVVIGRDINCSTTYFEGYVDEARITVGVARYRYNFTPPTKAFNDGDGNLATPTSDVLVGDSVNLPVFPYTTLLLHGDGTNNANNHAFVDSSNNNFAITRNGNASQGTFSPFSPTGWSAYFDGTGDGNSFGSNVNTNPSNSDITVEAWIYPLAYNSYGPIFSNDVNGGFHFGKIASGFGVRHYGTGDVVYTATTPPLNQWTHVAVSRSGNSWYLFYNGVLVATATASNTFTQGTACVGGNASTASEAWNGYLSNVRFVKGSALYTSNFTPSTTNLTAVTNTQLLTLQSNRFVDLSTNSYTATIFGTPSVQAFSPFAPSVEYTANTHGGSAYFDGTGDYLTTNATQAIPATADFTVEAWIYPTDSFGRTIVAQGTSGTAGRLQFNTASNNSLQLGVGSTIVYSSGTVTPNAWNYVAFTRTGSAVTFYVNGSSAGTATVSDSVQNTTLAIGSEWAGDPYRWLGYIGSVRVSNVLRTINSITTAPFSNDANTVFLANFTNAGILDSTGKLILETVGDVKVNTAIKKYGTGSIAFDGSGDRLAIPFTNDFLELGINGQNFTVEAWIYPTNAMASAGQILSKGGGTASWSTTSGAQYQFTITNNAISWNFNSSGSAISVAGGTAALNTWQHVAVTYDGATTRTFLNGLLQATSTSSYTAPTTRNLQYIGMTQSGGFTQEYFGYIDDLRVTKGIARYTQNFALPTTAFLTK